jgi:hypothetical protein
MSFLEGLLNVGKEVVTHADDIAYGALSEQYNKMVSDTQDRHRRFTAWGDEVQTDINERKKNLQLEEDNYNKLIAKLKSRTDADIDAHLLSKNLTIDEYLAPLSGQLGTGMFLGEEQTILPKVKSFLSQVGVQKGDPYVPSEVYFEKNKEKLDTQMQDISGMGYNTWRALTKKGELSMMTDTKAVEFTEQDKMKAIHEIGISLKTFDLWYEANTPKQETMAMFSKYLLIKKEAAQKATKPGETEPNLIHARAYENEMIASEGINLSHIGGLFPGVDENTIRSIGIQGNAALNMASSIVAEISGLNPNDKNYELKKQELINRANGYMTQAVNFALETDQRFKAAAMGQGEYDVSDVQKRVVRKIKATLPENAKKIFSEMTKAWDGRDSNAQFNFHNDIEGQGKINYAYTKVGANGIKTWFLIDSNGVEIQTNLTYGSESGQIRPDTEGGMAAVYKAIHDDIAGQIQTGRVMYTDKGWVRQVANNLGYQIDNETGRVISVNKKSINNLQGALYHGFRDKPIPLSKVEKEETDEFNKLVEDTINKW